MNKWTVEAAGYQCTVERLQGQWVVTFAGATVGRAPSLNVAIMRACGGLVTSEEATALAAQVAPDVGLHRPARAAASARSARAGGGSVEDLSRQLGAA